MYKSHPAKRGKGECGMYPSVQEQQPAASFGNLPAASPEVQAMYRKARRLVAICHWTGRETGTWVVNFEVVSYHLGTGNPLLGLRSFTTETYGAGEEVVKRLLGVESLEVEGGAFTGAACEIRIYRPEQPPLARAV